MFTALSLVICVSLASASEQSTARGAALYNSHCMMCHQAAGQGVPPVFPPLAQSDWMIEDRERTIRVLAEGLSGKITVNGVDYEGSMPAQMLDDGQVADLLTFVYNSWGNKGAAFTADEVAKGRATSRYRTYEKLVGASAYRPLPPPPAGWTLEEVVRLNEFATRLAGPTESGEVLVLKQKGDVKRLTPAGLLPWLQAKDYLDVSRGDVSAMGLTVGPDKRLWVVTNQRIEESGKLVINEVRIWRGVAEISEQPPQMNSWYHVDLPYGIGPFNHGVTLPAFGPDGNLWVSSGSRTDSGEAGKDPRFSQEGEHELTACLWRFEVDFSKDAASGPPEVVARGLRNPYGFDWDDEGNLFTTSNGPDADRAEELDIIVEGAHYGFPYQFADLPASKKPYPHTPDPPEGIEFTHAIRNIGPDGGKGFATFDPHSAPGGMMWCGDAFPEPLRGRFLMTRTGNMLGIPEDAGFDVLSVRPRRNAEGEWEAEVHTVLEGLGRPLDVLAVGPRHILILEYTRTTNYKDKLGMLPGRIIALKAAP